MKSMMYLKRFLILVWGVSPSFCWSQGLFEHDCLAMKRMISNARKDGVPEDVARGLADPRLSFGMPILSPLFAKLFENHPLTPREVETLVRGLQQVVGNEGAPAPPSPLEVPEIAQGLSDVARGQWRARDAGMPEPAVKELKKSLLKRPVGAAVPHRPQLTILFIPERKGEVVRPLAASPFERPKAAEKERTPPPSPKHAKPSKHVHFADPLEEVRPFTLDEDA